MPDNVVGATSNCSSGSGGKSNGSSGDSGSSSHSSAGEQRVPCLCESVELHNSFVTRHWTFALLVIHNTSHVVWNGLPTHYVLSVGFNTRLGMSRAWLDQGDALQSGANCSSDSGIGCHAYASLWNCITAS